MKFSYLRWVRIAVSLLFFLAVSFLFLDIFGVVPTVHYDKIILLQFIPSAVSFLGGAGFMAAGFILFMLLSLVFGRVYCSSICPLGTLQDIIIYTGRKLRKKRRYKFSASRKVLRYSILAAVIILLITGNIILVNFLDPYSNTGRILTGIVKPMIYLANNLAARTLEFFNVYALYPKNIKVFSWPGFISGSVFLVTIIIMSLKKERLFCNTLCPAGALMGIASKFSLVKIEIHKDSCSGCGLCERVCKANCINAKEMTVDFERCVGCYNCFTVCPREGVIFTNYFKRKRKYFSSSKREFIKKTAVYFLGLTGIASAQTIVPTKESKIPEGRKNPTSPPGAGSTGHFNDYCTACHLCVSACPTGVLQPSFLEYGFLGMLQPRMDFKKGFCNFECTACLDVCPTEAIFKKDLNTKKLIQTGKAKFIKDNCIVETEKKDCGACSEHCPTKAVVMVPVPNTFLLIPEVTEEYCTGCGACEYACPTKPYKAIYVEGNPVHQLAKKKKVEKIDEEVDLKEEFPF
jgi:ferredoxin